MISREAFSEVVVEILLREGPQEFKNLLSLVVSDDQYGYLSFRHSNIEQLLRECLAYYSEKSDQKFDLTFGYKWQATRDASRVHDSCLEISRSTPWIFRGTGEEFVYGIFSPKQMSEARQSGSHWYPIKIGRTRRDISTRLRELQTGSFQDLQLGLQICTNYSVRLESLLHRKLRERKLCESSSQSEWFLTSLEELERLTRSEIPFEFPIGVAYKSAS